jgi:class 3 adenylate cyclase
VSISIGIEWGEVLLGEIGCGRSRELMLIGDAVNVASRLECAAHALHAALVAGDALIDQVRRESGVDAPELANLVHVGPQRLHGRGSPVSIWRLPVTVAGFDCKDAVNGVRDLV